MINYLYIIYSFIIITLVWFGIHLYTIIVNEIFINRQHNNHENFQEQSKLTNSKYKVHNLKKKFNIKSTESSNQIKKFNRPNLLIHSINKKFSISDPHVEDIPNNILNLFDDPNSKITQSILKSFLDIKILYTKIFTLNNNPIITNIENFNNLYKFHKLELKKINGYNVCIKLYNLVDREYIIINKNILIKIKRENTNQYELICNELTNSPDKIFLSKFDSNLYLSIGNSFTDKINNEQIHELFFNNDNKQNLNKEYYSKLMSYSNITIFYWISSLIN